MSILFAPGRGSWFYLCMNNATQNTTDTNSNATHKPVSWRRTAEYALARGLRGFRDARGNAVTELRVNVTDRRHGQVFVVTADLLDAGTTLALDAHQVVAL